jgi:hypothetical protein
MASRKLYALRYGRHIAFYEGGRLVVITDSLAPRPLLDHLGVTVVWLGSIRPDSAAFTVAFGDVEDPWRPPARLRDLMPPLEYCLALDHLARIDKKIAECLRRAERLPDNPMNARVAAFWQRVRVEKEAEYRKLGHLPGQPVEERTAS